MMRWITLFLNDCTATVQLDGEIDDQELVKIGVPQGLPVAPILFMLFIAPLFKILTKKEKKTGIKIRGYVNYGFLTARASKKVISAAKIQEKFAKIEAWATQNGMVFDQAKFEAIHFSQKKHFPNPKIVLLPATTAGREERP